MRRLICVLFLLLFSNSTSWSEDRLAWGLVGTLGTASVSQETTPIEYVRYKYDDNFTGGSCTITDNLAVGELVVVGFVSYGNPIADNNYITDNASPPNTWYQYNGTPHETESSRYVQFFWSVITTAKTDATLTIDSYTPSHANYNYPLIIISHFTGDFDANPVDKTASDENGQFGGTGPTNVSTGTLSSANEVALAGCLGWGGSSPVWSGDSNFTLIKATGRPTQTKDNAYKIATTTDSITYAESYTDSVYWTCSIVTFKGN